MAISFISRRSSFSTDRLSMPVHEVGDLAIYATDKRYTAGYASPIDWNLLYASPVDDTFKVYYKYIEEPLTEITLSNPITGTRQFQTVGIYRGVGSIVNLTEHINSGNQVVMNLPYVDTVNRDGESWIIDFSAGILIGTTTSFLSGPPDGLSRETNRTELYFYYGDSNGGVTSMTRHALTNWNQSSFTRSVRIELGTGTESASNIQAYTSDGWVTASPNIYTNSGWKPTEIQHFNGTSWQ